MKTLNAVAVAATVLLASNSAMALNVGDSLRSRTAATVIDTVLDRNDTKAVEKQERQRAKALRKEQHEREKATRKAERKEAKELSGRGRAF